MTGQFYRDQVAKLIDQWISQASCSGMAPIVKAARTIRLLRNGTTGDTGGIDKG